MVVNEKIAPIWLPCRARSFSASTRVSRHDGTSSLRFDVNGGRAIYYSPPLRVDSLHSYILEGYIRTQRLKHDAGLISISFLNHKRQRVKRYLSRPVSGTHNGWVRVQIGPVAPTPDVRFIVVGCHIAHGKMMDIRGQVWFDQIRIGRLPRLTLVSNYHTHFKVPNAPIVISVKVGGLDIDSQYRLRLKMYDNRNSLANEAVYPLVARKPIAGIDSDDEGEKPIPVEWRLRGSPHGFYSVEAALERNKKVILVKKTTFVVMDLVEPGRDGEFGWSIANGSDEMPLRELADVAAQSGINMLKFPLWQSVFNNKPNRPVEITELFELLAHRRITPVGLLNKPPAAMRNKFGEKWSGVSEVFTMPPKFWWDSVEPVIARYSSSIRHWQLGGEGDGSFVGLSRLSQTVQDVKQEFDKIGRDTRVGFHWDWKTPLPSRDDLPHTFLSLSENLAPALNENRTPAEKEKKRLLDGTSLRKELEKSKSSSLNRWVLLRPLPKSKHSPEDRGRDLVQRMVAAKIGGAEAIFAADIFDEEYGLLNKNGSPALLYLPWRTTALALQGTEYLGSVGMPGGSENHLFVRDGEAVFVLWSEKPRTEELYLGENVRVTTIWGETTPAPVKRGTNRSIIDVGPSPVILRGCSEAVARWRQETHFEVAQLQSRSGGQTQTVVVRNTFPQGVSGTIQLNVPDGWSINPAQLKPIRAAPGETVKRSMKITVPSNASLGDVKVRIDFDLIAERKHSFQVYRTIKVGLGDVGMQVFDRVLKDGTLEIEQVITNNIKADETLNFRCNLFVPNQQRQRRMVTKLGRGKDRKFYYLPNAEALRGKDLRLRAEQVNGNRVLNFRWKVLGSRTRKKVEKKPTPKKGPPAKTPGGGQPPSGNQTPPAKKTPPNNAV
eukprot:g26506.t1